MPAFCPSMHHQGGAMAAHQYPALHESLFPSPFPYFSPVEPCPIDGGKPHDEKQSKEQIVRRGREREGSVFELEECHDHPEEIETIQEDEARRDPLYPGPDFFSARGENSTGEQNHFNKSGTEGRDFDGLVSHHELKGNPSPCRG